MTESDIQFVKRRAAYDFNKGLELSDNPYEKGTKAYEAYMLEMARLENEEFKRECASHGY